MTEVRPLSERHNVITEFGYLPYLGDWMLWRARSYWVMTLMTVITVITVITNLHPQLFWSGNGRRTFCCCLSLWVYLLSFFTVFQQENQHEVI